MVPAISGRLPVHWKRLDKRRDHFDPNYVRNAGRVVFPGQGSFGDCAFGNGLDQAMGAYWRGNPYLGICLGLQVLFERYRTGEWQARLDLPDAGRPGLKIPIWGGAKWKTLKAWA